MLLCLRRRFTGSPRFVRSFQRTQSLNKHQSHRHEDNYDLDENNSPLWTELQGMDYHQLDDWVSKNAREPKKRNPNQRYRKPFKSHTKLLLKGGFAKHPSFDGGHVIFRVADIEPNLAHLKQFYRGLPTKAGKNGVSILLDVPIGTKVTEFIPESDIPNPMEDLPPHVEEMDFVPYEERYLHDPTDDNTDENVFMKKIQTQQSAKFTERIDASTLSVHDQVHGKTKKGLVSAELLDFDEYFVAVKGGTGLTVPKASTKHTTKKPKKKAETMKFGESRWFNVEWEMVSKIGLVGLPSSGKDFLFEKISGKKQKTKESKFTKLKCLVKEIEMEKGLSVTVSDVTLRDLEEIKSKEYFGYLERVQYLWIVLDMGGKPYEDFNFHISEMKNRRTDYLSRVCLIVGMNMGKEKAQENFENFQLWLESSEFSDFKVFGVSEGEEVGVIWDYFREFERVDEREEKRDEPMAIDLSRQFQDMFDSVHPDPDADIARDETDGESDEE